MVTYFNNCIQQGAIHSPNPGRRWRGGIFLDRDGTIIVEKNYLQDQANLKFLPGSIPGLKKLAATGLPLYIFTNQAGVAHGYFTEETLNRIHSFLAAELQKAGITLRGIYYCPHHPRAEIEAYRCECPCRKPEPGLLIMAACTDQLDLTKSYVIGDKLSDLDAGKRVAAKTALVLTGYGPVEYKKINPEQTPDFIGLNLEEVAQLIWNDFQTANQKNDNLNQQFKPARLNDCLHTI